ncbi:polysaccharide biosynthesis protein [Paraburkholderia sp. Ac-20340]|uniref:lipopolysaccharide biosynthesis protein n=1 Tax=Paraburkholderia sp. Ac-20340 TaxID=2703888 RepID=UPI001980A226|nr:polysaccharide biosynthesis protein [Paraburkholderia sp. Ac-20340]MBN3854636.1 polysaccharide biosynthesis protein [Paraburkholderia sp. Ac-20340]
MHLIIRLGLRVTALVLKFVLTVVIARTLGFAAVADYGLALAVSVVASKLLGLGFSTEINRRLSLPNSNGVVADACRLMFIFGATYLLITAVVGLLQFSGAFRVVGSIRPAIIWSVTLVAFSEHAGLETNLWIFSMHRSRFGALLLFVRTGAWAALAIGGLVSGAIQSTVQIFVLWGGANGLVIAVVIFDLVAKKRRLEQRTKRERLDSSGVMLPLWLGGLPFFVATTFLSGLQYSERFIAGMVVPPSVLGKYVFCWSISNAIQTIGYATLAVTTGPRLVKALDVSRDRFHLVLRRSVLASLGLSAVGAASLLIASDFIFRVAHQPAGMEEFIVLGVLLVSFVFRSIADIYWSGAIALRLGKQVAALILLVALFAVPAGWLLVNYVGIVGAAIAHLFASIGVVALLLWLVGCSSNASCDAVKRVTENYHAS